MKTPFTFYILPFPFPFPAPPPLSLLRERGEGRIGVFIGFSYSLPHFHFLFPPPEGGERGDECIGVFTLSPPSPPGLREREGHVRGGVPNFVRALKYRSEKLRGIICRKIAYPPPPSHSPRTFGGGGGGRGGERS